MHAAWRGTAGATIGPAMSVGLLAFRAVNMSPVFELPGGIDSDIIAANKARVVVSKLQEHKRSCQPSLEETSRASRTTQVAGQEKSRRAVLIWCVRNNHR
jgi:hypothetical protein